MTRNAGQPAVQRRLCSFVVHSLTFKHVLCTFFVFQVYNTVGKEKTNFFGHFFSPNLNLFVFQKLQLRQTDSCRCHFFFHVNRTKITKTNSCTRPGCATVDIILMKHPAFDRHGTAAAQKQACGSVWASRGGARGASRNVCARRPKTFSKANLFESGFCTFPECSHTAPATTRGGGGTARRCSSPFDTGGGVIYPRCSPVEALGGRLNPLHLPPPVIRCDQKHARKRVKPVAVALRAGLFAQWCVDDTKKRRHPAKLAPPVTPVKRFPPLACVLLENNNNNLVCVSLVSRTNFSRVLPSLLVSKREATQRQRRPRCSFVPDSALGLPEQ